MRRDQLSESAFRSASPRGEMCRKVELPRPGCSETEEHHKAGGWRRSLVGSAAGVAWAVLLLLRLRVFSTLQARGCTGRPDHSPVNSLQRHRTPSHAEASATQRNATRRAAPRCQPTQANPSQTKPTQHCFAPACPASATS